MSDPKISKRNYIRRKKYLNDCIAKIKATFDFIRIMRREKVAPGESERFAMGHAQAIEAVCWSPHSHLSAESYQKLMAAKTQELCRTLLKKSLPALDMTQLQRLSTTLVPDRPHTPQPSLPMPILLQNPAPRQARSPVVMERSATFAQDFVVDDRPMPLEDRGFVPLFELRDDDRVINGSDQLPLWSLDDEAGIDGTSRRFEPSLEDGIPFTFC